jgi:hypothetical protein
MNIQKEVYDKCKRMIENELSDARVKLNINRREINKLAKEQRILKATVGQLNEMLRNFNR